MTKTTMIIIRNLRMMEDILIVWEVPDHHFLITIFYLTLQVIYMMMVGWMMEDIFHVHLKMTNCDTQQIFNIMAFIEGKKFTPAMKILHEHCS